MLLKLSIFLILVSNNFICNNYYFFRNQTYQDEKNNICNEYTTVEVYCWCFGGIQSYSGSKKSMYYTSTCTVIKAIEPKELLDEKYKIASSNNPVTILKICSTLGIGEYKQTEIENNIDARFLLVLKRKDNSIDIFSTNNGSNFYFGKEKSRKYNFNVIEAIRKSLKLKKINCNR
jgi:hypothetical protein